MTNNVTQISKKNKIKTKNNDSLQKKKQKVHPNNQQQTPTLYVTNIL